MTTASAVLVKPRQETPWLTYALVAANVAAFVACGLYAGTFFPMSVPAPVLIALGANVAPFTQFGGQWENLCTNTFLHGGFVHLLFNLVALFQVGPFVERAVGRARFAIMYVLSGIAASAMSMIAANYGYLGVGLAVGASGAICGLIGGAAVLGFRLQGRRSPLAGAMLRWLGITVVFGYAITVSGAAHVDNYAHVGGALFGGACALLFRKSVQYTAMGRVVRIAGCAAVCVAAFVVQLGRGASVTRAKLDYAYGRCESVRNGLHQMRVSSAAEAEIASRCETQR